MYTIRISLIFIMLAMMTACSPEKPPVTTHQVKFTISWENTDSFEDFPEFDDRELDETLQRFQDISPGGTEYYFTDGLVTVELPEASDEKAVSAVAHAVARETLPDAEISWRKTPYKILGISRTRFGYFVNIEWGSPEEDYEGHVLWMMVDLPRRHIWWNRCD